jgi:hypothetical protein
MSCCGERRAQFNSTNINYQAHNPAVSIGGQLPVSRQTLVCFEYVGKTGLTVLGPVSGKRYRFEYQGARVLVDPGDRPSLASVPNLRQIWIP